MYSGPNRRSDWPVVELRIDLCDKALSGLADRKPDAWTRHLRALMGNRSEQVDWNELSACSEPIQYVGQLMVTLLLNLQGLAGQKVRDCGLINPAQANVCDVFVAFDHPEVFHKAFDLARRILVFGLHDGDSDGEGHRLQASIRELTDHFADSGTPADVWAMMQVAHDRGIPLLRMDRPPYDPVEGSFRIRRNGLVRFGHGHRQLTVDGTFCVTRSASLHPLVFDRAGLLERLSAMGWKLPETVRCATLRRVERALRRMEFPVAVRSARCGVRRSKVQPLADLESVVATADGILSASADVLLQPWIGGQKFRVMAIGGKCCLIQPGEGEPWHEVNPSMEKCMVGLDRLAESLGVGALVVELAGSPNEIGSVMLLDAELAPRLDELLDHQPRLLEFCASRFVDWLFPDPELARIPIAAITGTNGKTTTCHMTRSILTAAGFGVGMTCSDGCMIGGEWITEKEEGHFVGHTIVLDNPDTEVAVLESTRGGAGSIGMGFSSCQVAACLNVTEDHLEDRIGHRSVEDVADLKRTILERSDDAIVLNADDVHCMAMRESLSKHRLGLVSATRDYTTVKSLDAGVDVIGVLESINGQPWLVLYHRGERHMIMACSAMPLSFGNRAGHNLDNALHAAVISFLMGATAEQIAMGLRTLRPDFETLRGRLNHCRELPFEVILDYAHNPDGLARLCRYVDHYPSKGRKLINLAIGGQNPDDFVRRSAAVTAGHFDHFVCKNFGLLRGRQPEECPRLLREGLLTAGVDESAITCIEDEFESIDFILNLARPGDLVVIIGGKRKRQIWDWIRSWGERQAELNKSPT